MKRFPIYIQPDTMDCGPKCVRMISKYYNRTISLQKLRDLSQTTRSGSSLQGMADAAEKIGFRSLGVKIDFDILVKEAPLPCIVFWNERHFVVVYKIKKIILREPQKSIFKNEKISIINSGSRSSTWFTNLFQTRIHR